MVDAPVEERGGPLRDAGYRRPFAERQIGHGDARAALAELADQVEQDLAAGLCEREVCRYESLANFVADGKL